MSSVIKISEAASIAFHSMIYLTQNNGRIVTVKEIARAFDISENHLSKVKQRLVKSRMVESIKGPNGGFKLIKNNEDISFLKIYEAIDGAIKQDGCLFEDRVCDGTHCIMGKLLDQTNRQVKEYFENKMLSDFLKKE